MYKYATGITVTKVKCSDIVIDRAYQRDLDQARAQRMSERFNVGLFGVPVVSVRPDGTMAVLDGQHRITARITAGKGADDILVEAHYGLTLKQEAELFLRLNGGRTSVRNWDKWRARLVARDPVALEMTSIAESHGAKFSPNGHTKNGISALNRAERVHRKFKTLNETIGLLVAIGAGDDEWLSGDMLLAVGSFLSKYGKAVDRNRLIIALAKEPPAVFAARIRGKSVVMGFHFEHMAQIEIAELYNVKAKGQYRLK